MGNSISFAPFDGAEPSLLQELMLEVMPHSNKYKNQSIKDSFFFGICDFLDENPSHWIFMSLKDRTSEPVAVIETFASKLEEEYREFVSMKKDPRHRGGKLPKFRYMEWDSTREFVNEKGVKIRYSKDGKKISLKAMTTGLVADLSDFDSLMVSVGLEYKDITIPKFFRLVSFFHSSKGKDSNENASRFFKSFPSLMVFEESLAVEMGWDTETIKKEEVESKEDFDFLFS
jgi:hypothetical protein